jgi:glutathione S-transferase
VNPNALVPVLIDERGPIWESNAICRYVAAGTPLFPDDRRQRALIDQWMDWQCTELNTAWRYAFAGLVRKTPGFDDPKQIAASVTAWNTAMGLLSARWWTPAPTWPATSSPWPTSCWACRCIAGCSARSSARTGPPSPPITSA